MPTELAQCIERLREQIEAQGYDLPLGELVTKALRRAAVQAERDLEQLQAREGRADAAARNDSDAS